jgi:hypothetical protein
MPAFRKILPLLFFATAVPSCDGKKAPPVTPTASATAEEWVGYHVEIPVTPDAFATLGSDLFGTSAQNGQFLPPFALAAGVYLSSEPETATSTQSRIRISFDDMAPATGQRVLALAPASFQLGQLFLTATQAAIATMHADEMMQAGSGESFYLEYRVNSTQGGTMSLGLRGALDAYTFVVDIQSPPTHLNPSQIGMPAMPPGAYDTVAGTVWFHLSLDEFSFFSNHAYGSGATGAQNFTDFQLVPFDWLRLTVTPHIDQQYVNVGFDILATDNTRTAFASAPASVLAGAQFQALVERNMSAMQLAEAAKPGSSSPWSAPFYYDSPDTGGVVQVVASGAAGIFEVAYAVASPQHSLTEVPFLAYTPVTIQPEDPNASASCQSLGGTLSPNGVFDITFSASTTITQSPDLKGPLVGPIYCSVFNASDVNAAGPIAGANSLQDFQLPSVNLSSGPAPTFTTNTFYSGNYQILCFQDLDGDGNASGGDPVTLPIGNYPLQCNTNAAAVQFALLDPQ